MTSKSVDIYVVVVDVVVDVIVVVVAVAVAMVVGFFGSFDYVNIWVYNNTLVVCSTIQLDIPCRGVGSSCGSSDALSDTSPSKRSLHSSKLVRMVYMRI